MPRRPLSTLMQVLPGLVLLLAAAPAFADVEGFQTPTGNISCSVGQGEGLADIDCTIYERAGPPATPRLARCNAAWGHRFLMQEHGVAKAECGPSIGSVPHGPDPSTRTVKYGVTEKFGGIVCRSSASALECHNADGHGFSLSRQRQSIF